jgi:hypothetical protein
MTYLGGTLGLLLIGLAILVVVLWVMLPFAVFGMKPLLREAVREQAETRRALERLLDAVQRGQGVADPAKPPSGYKPNWPN